MGQFLWAIPRNVYPLPERGEWKFTNPNIMLKELGHKRLESGRGSRGLPIENAASPFSTITITVTHLSV